MTAVRWIERVRRLPANGEILVQVGEQVVAEQTVGQVNYLPGALQRVDVAHPLRVDGRELRAYLLRGEDDAVAAGETLAVSSCFGERRAVTAPCSGHVGLISRNLGHLYIREPVPLGVRQTVVVAAAEQLGVGLLQFRDCLRVTMGWKVTPGQVLAVKRAGLKQQVVQSPIYGQVTEIRQGLITLQPLHLQTELKAYLSGVVTAVQPHQAVTVAAWATVVAGRYGVGGEAGGELRLIERPASGMLCAADVSLDWQGKVIVASGTAELPALRQAADVGVRALAVNHLDLGSLLQYAGGAKAIGSTGDEELTMPLILFSGFQPAAFPTEVWSRLQPLQGRYASVNATTHIRAGVIRPEIVICADGGERPREAEVTAANSGLTVGSNVRVLRGRCSGLIGRVLELPLERRALSTGSFVPVAIVCIGEEAVQLPLANLAAREEE